MFKTVLKMLAGALVFSAVTAAIAQGFGTAPLQYGDQALIDQKWLYGLSGGVNYTYQSAITAAGTNQATAKALPNLVSLMSIDTVGASTGVALPSCIQGTGFSIYNNTATALLVYPAVVNNPVTAAQDTINNTTSVSVSGHTAEFFFCPKNGVWAAK